MGRAHFFIAKKQIYEERMINSKLIDELERISEPVLNELNLTLVDIEYRKEGGRWILRFYIDKKGGISIEDCARFSQEMGDLLDVHDIIPARYNLEVSSPGLCRALKKDRDFEWAVERNVHIWTKEPIDGKREVSGRLCNFSDDKLTIKGTEKDIIEIPFSMVSKARLEPDF